MKNVLPISLFVLGLLVGILASRQCSRVGNSCPELAQADTVVEFDTINVLVTGGAVHTEAVDHEPLTSRPQNQNATQPEAMPIPAIIDTSAVIAAFYGLKNYKSTYADSILSLTIMHSVNQGVPSINELQYKVTQPTKTITNNYVVPPKTKVYVGAATGYVAQQIYLGPMLAVATKKGTLLTAQGNLFQQSFNITVGAAFKLGKK